MTNEGSARKLIVVVNGHPRSGKDTVVSHTISALEPMGWDCKAISSIDPVRNVLRSLGIPVDRKTSAERDLMAEVKASLEKYDRWASRACMADAEEFLSASSSSSSAVFVHVREPDAIAFMRSICRSGIRFATVFVDRRDALRVISNAADAAVEQYDYDLILHNLGGLDDLSAAAKDLAVLLDDGAIGSTKLEL